MNDTLTFRYTIDGDDFTRAGEASSSVKNKLKQLGLDSDVIRKVAIAMYEGEINMVIHADGGEITVSVSDSDIDHDPRGQRSGDPGCGPGHAGGILHSTPGSPLPGLWRRHGTAEHETIHG